MCNRWPYRFVPLMKSRGSCGPRDSSPTHFFIFEAVLNIQKPPFFAATFAVTLHETERRQVHDFQVWSSFFSWLSGEVKHIVHLIRWNLKAVLCQLGQDLTTVPVQGTIARTVGLGTGSCFLINCFGFCLASTSSPLVPNLSPRASP